MRILLNIVVFAVCVAFSFVLHEATADPTFTVRCVYFLPSNSTAELRIDTKLDSLVKQGQRFYASEIARHGYGQKTFRLETDTRGKVVLHRVNGRFTSHYYHQNHPQIESELPQEFRTQNNIVIVFVEGNTTIASGTCGVGWDVVNTGRDRGYVLVPASGDCLNVSVVAHELGHAFGLRHNLSDPTYLMGAGNDYLAPCEAEWLSVHHYFNTPHTLNSAPKITRIHSPIKANDDTVRYKVDIHDLDGLVQAHFFFPSGIELVGCSSLSGQSDTAEFVVPQWKVSGAEKIIAQAIDTNGNYYLYDIPISLETLASETGVTYLSFISGTQPTPNNVGINPKNPSHQWTSWKQSIDNRTNNGNKIVINGTAYPRGISMTPPSILEYDLTGGNYASFSGYLGLADEHDMHLNTHANASCRAGGSVVFTFKIDGSEVFKSEKLTGADAPVKATFEIPANAQTLQILVDAGGDGNWCDAAAIGDAKLIHGSSDGSSQPNSNTTSNPDVNRDGKVDLVDLVIVASSFGTTIHGEISPNPDVNGDGVVDTDDILLVTDVLESALAPARVESVLAPALLPNFPNPCNPETWIPYQLSEASDVTVSIYSADGKLVRTLALGYQTPGIYQSKNHAAYWDGRNELGEPVASGIYFYTLKAGDFFATRKMVIVK